MELPKEVKDSIVRIIEGHESEESGGGALYTWEDDIEVLRKFVDYVPTERHTEWCRRR